MVRCSRTSRTSISSSALPSWHGGSSASESEREENAMFVNFFLELRQAKVPVSIKEYLALMEAMDKHVADYSVDNFYYLSRSVLEKDERNLDKFDRVFGHVFKSLEALPPEGATAEIPEEWLRKLAEKLLTATEKAQIEAMRGSGDLMETLRQRLHRH